jgi:hypothetical protein
MPQTLPEYKQKLIKTCKELLKQNYANPWEPKLISECDRILEELDKDPLPYDIFDHKKTNGLIDSWV